MLVILVVKQEVSGWLTGWGPDRNEEMEPREGMTSPERCRLSGNSLNMVVWARGGTSWWPVYAKNIHIYYYSHKKHMWLTSVKLLLYHSRAAMNVLMETLCLYVNKWSGSQPWSLRPPWSAHFSIFHALNIPNGTFKLINLYFRGWNWFVRAGETLKCTG